MNLSEIRLWLHDQQCAGMNRNGECHNRVEHSMLQTDRAKQIANTSDPTEIINLVHQWTCTAQLQTIHGGMYAEFARICETEKHVENAANHPRIQNLLAMCGHEPTLFGGAA